MSQSIKPIFAVALVAAGLVACDQKGPFPENTLFSCQEQERSARVYEEATSDSKNNQRVWIQMTGRDKEKVLMYFFSLSTGERSDARIEGLKAEAKAYCANGTMRGQDLEMEPD